MRAYRSGNAVPRAMAADLPERAREEFGRRLDDYDRALHREIAARLAEIARTDGG